MRKECKYFTTRNQLNTKEGGNAGTEVHEQLRAQRKQTAQQQRSLPTSDYFKHKRIKLFSQKTEIDRAYKKHKIQLYAVSKREIQMDKSDRMNRDITHKQ